MQHKISEVSQQPPDHFTTKAGHQLVAYKFKVEGDERVITINQKPDTDPPQVGQTIDGTIEESSHGPKFKKEYQQAATGGATGAGPKGPGEQASIEAQSVAKAAGPSATSPEDFAARIKAGFQAVQECKASVPTQGGAEGKAQQGGNDASQGNTVTPNSDDDIPF